MQRKSCLLLYLALCAFSVFELRADQSISEQDLIDIQSEESDTDETRALLPVPDAINLTSRPEYTHLVTPAALGKKTSNFGCCKVFQLTKSLSYVPDLATTGDPMIRMTGKGATFDMLHNCVNFKRTGTVTNCVGIEVGDSSGTSLPLDTITIENGIMTNWDVAIVVHKGVRNVVLKNLVLTNNTIPIAFLGASDNEITTVYMENVYIVGSNEDRLSSLGWIRSKITDGGTYATSTATDNYGYNNYDNISDPTMGLECNPSTANADKDLHIYTGIYANYVANMQMRNVSVSNIGYNAAVESSAAYGMWFSNCSSIFMEDVEATKTISGLTAVGAYFDKCNVLSVKKANITNTFINDNGSVDVDNTCPYDRWAAAVVLKDCSNVSSEDVDLSNTAGKEFVWGVRVILNPVEGSDAFSFENVWANYLRGDAVTGFDLGDAIKGSIRHLKMKNVSVSSALGPDKTVDRDAITGYFKGIYLGTGSKDLELENIRIESNLGVTGTAAASTDVTENCSGIEFYDTIENLRLKDVSISGNKAASTTTADNGFCGIRGVANTAPGTNLFKDITMNNVQVENNSHIGLNLFDTEKIITVSNLTLDNCSFSDCGNIGIAVSMLESGSLKNCHFDKNVVTGAVFHEINTLLTISNSTMNNNKRDGCFVDHGNGVLKVKECQCAVNGGHGLTTFNSFNHIDISDSVFDLNNYNGISFANSVANSRNISITLKNSTLNSNGFNGIFCNDIKTIFIENCQFNSNGGGTSLAVVDRHGITVNTSCDVLKCENITVNSNARDGLYLNSVKDFQCDGFNVDSNVHNGINLIGTSHSVVLKNGSVTNISNSESNDIHGIQIETVDNFKADNLIIKDILNAAESAYGLMISNGIDTISLSNIAVNNITGAPVISTIARGLSFFDVKNGSFKNINIENVTAGNNEAVGIVFDSSDGTIISAQDLDLENITINDVSSEALVKGCCMKSGKNINLKNVNFSNFKAITSATALRLECLAGTGFDSFHVDGFNFDNQSGTETYGIYVKKSDIMNNGVRPLTDASFKNGSANNNISTAGNSYGIKIEQNSSTSPGVGASAITFENVSTSQNKAVDGDVYGLYLNNGEKLILKNIDASHNTSKNNTNTTTHTTHGIFLDTAVDNLKLENVVTNGNSADAGSVIGLEVDKVSVVSADGVTANDNTGSGAAVDNNVTEAKGIFFKATIGSDASECSILNNLQACGNTNAYRAYGIHIQEPTGVSMSHIDASLNKSDQTGVVNSLPVLSQAIGVYLEGGSSVTIDDLNASVNQQNENAGDNLAVDATSEAAANTTSSIARNFPVANKSGAYGLLADATHSFKLDGAIAKENKGVRAFGVMVRDADHPYLKNIESSENEATGDALNDLAGITDVTAMEIPSDQAQTIFGGMNSNSTINLQEAYKDYIRALSVLRTDSALGDSTSFCDNSSTGTASGSVISATHNIIQSTIAQYRRFSTSVGIGILNCNGATVDGCTTIGNKSLSDSAAGIAIYGDGNKGHIIKDCISGRNQAWTESNCSDTFALADINISKWLSLYTKLKLAYLSASGPNAYTTTVIESPITKAMIDFKPTDTFDFSESNSNWTLRHRRLSVEFTAGTNDASILYDFTAVGPIAAGIILERQRDAHIIRNYAYSNHGNAALGFGILSDATASSMIMDNKLISNEANHCGHAWGMVDFAYSTPNSWFRNWMHANRDDINLNSALMIVFDTTASANQLLPLQTIQPGSVESLAKASDVDNISVEYVGCRQRFDGFGDGVRTYLDNNNISTSDILPSAYADC